MTATEKLREPIDGASVAAFRAIFGVLMIAAVVRFFAYGWIDQLFVDPKFHFTYAGLDWIRPWSRPWMFVHFAVLGVLALAIAIGFYTRIAAALFFLGFTYVELIDKANYLNHYYLVSLLALLFVFIPTKTEALPRWCLHALRAQVGMVYFFAGLAKLKHDWLFEAQPLRIWLSANSDVPLIGPLLGQVWVAYAASWAAAIFDLSLVFLLLHKKTRYPAMIVAVIFHASTAVLFTLGLFPWIMTAALTLFLDPSWPRTLFRRPLFERPVAAPPATLKTKLGFAVLAVHLTVQALLPLRHYALSDDLLWTEDHFRFAWHVMVREKSGRVLFHAREKSTGREWLVYGHEYLTPLQTKMMSTTPDMIEQLAQKIAADFKSKGHDVEVRAEAYASLNGRPSELLIDPEKVLAR